MKRLQQAFTLVELLVVIAIIALLVAILMPALGKIRTQAKVAALKVTFHSMTMGLEQFRNDFGSYPSSKFVDALDFGGPPPQSSIDTGAHLLVQAMAGLDLLGYAENEYYNYNANGVPTDPGGNEISRDGGPYVPVDKMDVVNFRNMTDAAERNSWYEKVGFSGVSGIDGNLNPIFTDDFNNKTARPILYYKANKRGNLIHEIYNHLDNALITDEYGMANPAFPNYIDTLKNFYYFIWDTNTGVGTAPVDKVNHPTARPYNRDSFILWSAGPDGEYGTQDDVTNFERK